MSGDAMKEAYALDPPVISAEEAVDLVLDTDMPVASYKEVAYLFNSKLPEGDTGKYGKGATMPCWQTVRNEMVDAGAALSWQDLVPIYRREEGGEGVATQDVGEQGGSYYVVDDDDESFVEMLGTSADTPPMRVEPSVHEREGYKLSGVMMRQPGHQLVVRELLDIKELMPNMYTYLVHHGFDLFFAFDGSGRRVFEHVLIPTELGCAKPHIPGVQEAQQSPHLGIPIFLYEGKEDHAHLSVVLEALKKDGCFVDRVEMPDGNTIRVRWHLSGDLKALQVCLGCGYCPWCDIAPNAPVDTTAAERTPENDELRRRTLPMLEAMVCA
jgi:hypothetical protein